jgi:uncharacterized iron-regulated membrane protein
MSTSTEAIREKKDFMWQQWLHHPEKLWAHRIHFQVHLWLGMLAGLYILVMSISGSMIVFRNELEGSGDQQSKLAPVVEWLVNLHDNLLSGMTGRTVNGIGAIGLGLLCLTGTILWWPGIAHWRRSLSVNWRSNFARLNWDLHNALGFWCFLFVFVWGISGIYFAFSQPFNAMADFLAPTGTSNSVEFGQLALFWLSNLHFGRFGWFVEALWTALGLVPAILAFTGILMCCHRLFVRKNASLPR